MARGPSRQEREVQEFREIMEVPNQFEDGFGARTIVGAIFLGLFMLPGSMYLSLFMGGGLGPAARWVTVILFAEVAKRSLKHLRQQEIFILFYMTGIALASPFQGLLWNQYLVQSDAAQAMGVAAEVPKWVAPSPDIMRQTGNTFLNKFWLAPILLISLQLVITRINGFGLGYVLYRLTAHGERLPFPMAPVEAQGVLSLVDDRDSPDPSSRWRWTAFAIGGMLGLMFGFLYVGIPSFTGAFLLRPYTLLPIPWLDLTSTFQRYLPATPVNLVFDLSIVVLGMVLPFWAVIGGGCALITTYLLNPHLQRVGILTSWKQGMGVVDTLFSNQVDFYLSFTIGLTVTILLITLGQVSRPLLRSLWRSASASASGIVSHRASFWEIFGRNRLRGDIPVWVSLAIYVCSTIGYIALSRYLLGPRFPWKFFLVFGFLYTPLVSYTSAKVEGLVGQTVSIPYVQEAAFILSGYKGVDIWFAPIPIVDYGTQVRSFRVVELTGTRVTSLIKTELVTVPVIIVASLLFSEFIWRLGPVPSESYPFAQQVWRQYALNACYRYTATMEGGSKFIESLNPSFIGWGMGLGLVSFSLLSILNLPTFLFYGFVRGFGQMSPGHIAAEVTGALLGRFYFERRFGRKQWRRVIPVVFAGFSCGLGLMAMAAVGITLISKSISTLLY